MEELGRIREGKKGSSTFRVCRGHIYKTPESDIYMYFEVMGAPRNDLRNIYCCRKFSQIHLRYIYKFTDNYTATCKS